MDWLMLVLILAFLFWAFQMIVVYRRQIERYDEQILQVRENTDEVANQVSKYEEDHWKKKEELDALRQSATDLDEKIKELRAADSARRSTRFRLDNVDPSVD